MLSQSFLNQAWVPTFEFSHFQWSDLFPPCVGYTWLSHLLPEASGDTLRCHTTKGLCSPPQFIVSNKQAE